jgi:predicted glycoside hydrolase/deacetylase ChbG (UPF0249 family)
MNFILNADDFGISGNVNQTVQLLHRKGILNNATLVSFGSCFEEAVEIAWRNPELDIGVHLCLDGPFNSGKDHKTIVDKNTGYFYSKRIIINKLRWFRVDEKEIFREYCHQVEKVLDHHIPVSHLDHHHHLHLYLPALKAMINVAKKYRIPFIRSQRIFMHSQGNLLNGMYRRAHQFYLKVYRSAVDGYFEPLIKPGSDDTENFERLRKLTYLKNKTIEIMLHPIDTDDPETRFFTSEKVLNLLGGLNLIRYRDLMAKPHYIKTL